MDRGSRGSDHNLQSRLMDAANLRREKKCCDMQSRHKLATVLSPGSRKGRAWHHKYPQAATTHVKCCVPRSLSASRHPGAQGLARKYHLSRMRPNSRLAEGEQVFTIQPHCSPKQVRLGEPLVPAQSRQRGLCVSQTWHPRHFHKQASFCKAPNFTLRMTIGTCSPFPPSTRD